MYYVGLVCADTKKITDFDKHSQIVAFNQMLSFLYLNELFYMTTERSSIVNNI